MVVEVVAVCTLVAKIASIIGLFEKVLTTCAWLKKVASTKWKKELKKYIEYLQVVKEVTGRYRTLNCSETSITGALQLLDGELTESWSKVDKWMPTTRAYKQLWAADFIKEMKSSRTTIDQNLQLFSTAVQTWERKEGSVLILQEGSVLIFIVKQCTYFHGDNVSACGGSDQCYRLHDRLHASASGSDQCYRLHSTIPNHLLLGRESIPNHLLLGRESAVR